MATDMFWVDSYIHNVAQNGAESNIVLAAGEEYEVTVDGNWTAWADENHQGELWQYFSYGAGDFVEPKYHSYAIPRSLRHSQFNAEWHYADHNPGVPKHDHTGVVWNLGSGWVHDQEPVDGIGATWDATNHIYTYRLIGQGQKLRVATTDNNRFDNDGMLLITIGGGGGWKVGVVNWNAGGQGSTSPILIPWSATGWRYVANIPFSGGGDPYAHDPSFTAPSFDDSGWAVGQAPFGGSGDGRSVGQNTQWDVQTGIKLRRKVNVGSNVDLQLHVKVDNVAYIYWNGELLFTYNNEYQGPGAGRVFTIPALKVDVGENTLAVMAWEEFYNYGSAEGGFIDMELKRV